MAKCRINGCQNKSEYFMKIRGTEMTGGKSMKSVFNKYRIRKTICNLCYNMLNPERLERVTMSYRQLEEFDFTEKWDGDEDFEITCHFRKIRHN